MFCVRIENVSTRILDILYRDKKLVCEICLERRYDLELHCSNLRKHKRHNKKCLKIVCPYCHADVHGKEMADGA